MDQKHSRILLKSNGCLILQPEVVEQLGRSAAILLQQIHYWLSSPQKVGKEIEGRRWIYNSTKAWAEDIKALSESTIKRAVAKLREEGLILTKNLNPHASNRTNWYTLDYDRLQELFPQVDSLKNVSFQENKVKMTQPLAQNDPILYTYTKNTSEKESLTDEVQEKAFKNNIAEELLGIWNEATQQQCALTKKRAQYLVAAFKSKFDACLEKWRDFCERIASSDFLMGRVKSTFRATLDWVLKFEIMQRIFEGDFGVRVEKSTQIVTMDPRETMAEIDIRPEPEDSKMIRKSLLNAFGVQTYKNWFSHVDFKRLSEKTLTLSSENSFCVTYIRDHYGWKIEDLLGVSLSY